MKIIELFAQSVAQQKYWTDRIAAGDWRAAPYLANHLRQGTFQKLYGPDGKVLLLTDGNNLASFCTLVQQDEIPDINLFPWIGFVYTFPAYRGHRYSEQIIRHACAVAKTQGYSRVYISSEEQGLYEKYGFTFWRNMRNLWGEETQVFTREL